MYTTQKVKRTQSILLLPCSRLSRSGRSRCCPCFCCCIWPKGHEEPSCPSHLVRAKVARVESRYWPHPFSSLLPTAGYFTWFSVVPLCPSSCDPFPIPSLDITLMVGPPAICSRPYPVAILCDDTSFTTHCSIILVADLLLVLSSSSTLCDDGTFKRIF